MNTKIQEVQNIFSNVADAIRDKTATTISYYASDFATEIRNIPDFGNVKSTLISLFTDTISEITIPSAITSELRSGIFQNSPTIQRVDFNNTTVIPSYAFQSCSNLTTITGISNITQIDASAFYNCSNLNFPDITEENFPNLTSIDYWALNKVKLYKVDTTKINSLPAYTFQSNSYLSMVNLPEMTSIPMYCFYSCVNLTSASIPKCTNIENFAFCDCINLTNISIPSIITTIGCGAFKSTKINIQNITDENFPNLTSISYEAFDYCSNISFVSLSNIRSIAAFNNCINISYAYLPNCTSLGEYVGGIGWYGAFSGCSNLESIEISPDCNFIGIDAFNNCTKLSNIINLNFNKLTFLGGSAFYSTPFASTITELYLPNVTNYATTMTPTFNDFINLEKLYIPNLGYIGANYIFNSLPKISKIYMENLYRVSFRYTYMSYSVSSTLNMYLNTSSMISNFSYLRPQNYSSRVFFFVPTSFYASYCALYPSMSSQILFMTSAEFDDVVNNW